MGEQVDMGIDFISTNKNVLVVSVTSGIPAIAVTAWDLFFPLYILALGGSYEFIGLLLSIKVLIWNVVNGPFGYLSDIRGRKIFVTYGMIILGLVHFMYACIDNYVLFIIPKVLESIINGAYAPALLSMIGEYVEPKERTRAFATWMTFSVTLSGFGAIIGAYVWVGFNNLQMLMFISGVLLILCGFARVIFLKEPLYYQKNHRQTKSTKESIYDFLMTIRKIFSARNALMFYIISYILTGAALNFISRLYLLYTIEVIHFTPILWGFYSAFTQWVTPLISIMSGKVSSYVSNKTLILTYTSTFAVTTLLLVITNDIWICLIILIIDVVIHYLTTPGFRAIWFELAEKDKRGTTMGFAASLKGLLVFPAPYFGAYIYAHVGKAVPFYIASMLLIIASIVLVRNVKIDAD